MSEGERDAVTAKFLRGLTIGAIIGAIVAGSALLGRRVSSPIDARISEGGNDEPASVEDQAGSEAASRS
jgi:hypothetical protein